jgi:carbon storage regulator
MLVLTRKIGEQIRVGDDIVVTLVRIQGDKVRVGIDAPRDVPIHREEVRRRLAASHQPVRTPAGVHRPLEQPRVPSDPLD